MSHSYIKHSLLMTASDIQDDSYTDEELVAFIQSGYCHMTVILCQRYVPLITKYAHVRQLHSIDSDLESALWECFLQAIKTYDITSNIPFAGFVKSRIRFTQWNLYRKSLRQWTHETVLAPQEDETDPLVSIPSSHDTAEEAIHHLELLALHTALSEMEPVHANLLRQVLLKGKSISEIANTYGMSRQAMHKKYKRAIALLKEALETVK